MISRTIDGPLREALADTPVVCLTGGRQVGKSTLAQTLVPAERYLTLDDPTVLASAQADPVTFIARHEALTVIDEVQRAPELFRAIKASVDRGRRPGRFLLTGSADMRLIPRLADPLVGRMETLTLWPLSQGEIEGHRERFLDAIRRSRLPGDPPMISLGATVERIVRGGYPAVHALPERRRAAWLGAYVTGVLERDVRELTSVEAIAALSRLVTLLATRVATLVNLADVSRVTGIPHTTLQRYMALLERTFLIHSVPGWGTKLGARVLKSSKLVFADTGAAAALLRLGTSRLGDEAIAGPMLENFVIMELRKQASWHDERPTLYHFLTPKGIEVDVVLEFEDGGIVGIEATRSRTVAGEDFRGLRELARIAGKRFRAGVILYLGDKVLPFGGHLHALPLTALWAW